MNQLTPDPADRAAAIAQQLGLELEPWQRRVARAFLTDPSFPRQGPQDIHVPLSSLTPAGPGAQALDARFPLPVPARPQDCDCGASQPAMVAHHERCTSRFPRGCTR